VTISLHWLTTRADFPQTPPATKLAGSLPSNSKKLAKIQNFQPARLDFAQLRRIVQ
jgi:hypothetical protein